MSFTLPQFGIFARGTQAHHFLEFDFGAGVTPDQAVASFRRLRTPDVSAGGVNVVIAFGALTCPTVAPSRAPLPLSPSVLLPGAVDGGPGGLVPQNDPRQWTEGGAQ